MFKLFGFLTGVFLTAGLVLLILEPETAGSLGRSMVQEVPFTITEVLAVKTPVAENPGAGPEHGRPQEAAPREASQLPDPDPVVQPSVAGDGTYAGAALPEIRSSDTETGVQRSLFWRPFRSRYAAQGFAKRIQQSTGVDVKVVQLAPGKVRVAIHHADDQERQLLVARIESITGLDLSGSLE